jgi:p-aminobenzoyl-glutamate transporter AbgT
MADISVGEPRLETSQEEALRLWFEEQEKAGLSNLEAGARQIIQLVTAFYGVIFGALSLGGDSLEASLHYRWVIIPGMAAVLALLGAMIAALVVVLPLFSYRYNPHKPAEQQAAYRKMVSLKSRGLRLAVVAFGIGLVAFAWLIISMLYYR